MSPDIVNGPTACPRGEFGFAQGLILHARPQRMCSKATVGEINFRQAVAANGRDLMEDDVIPNSPGNDQQSDTSSYYEDLPPFPSSIQEQYG